VGQTVQFGTGEEISIGKLAELAVRIAGRDDIDIHTSVPQRKRPPESEVNRLLASYELARKLTGWQPQVKLAEGLSTTADWIRSHPSLYRPGEYRI